MPVPIAPPVTLAGDEQSRLESIVRAHSTPQALAFRCQVILRAVAPDGPLNLQVATELPGTAILLAVGAIAILTTASVACTMRRAPVGRGVFPPQSVWM